MTDIFEEVSADLRRDRMQTAWDTYGRYIIGLAVAIVVITATAIGISGYSTSQNEAASSRYDAMRAALADLDTEAQLSALTDFAAAEDNGYGVLAQFSVAYLHVENSNDAAALQTFDSLADDGSVPDSMRNFAQLQAAIVAINSGAALGEIEARLEDLMDADSGLQPMARETMALAFMRDDRLLEARDLWLEQLADAAATGLARERATIMLDKIALGLVSPSADVADPIEGEAE